MNQLIVYPADEGGVAVICPAPAAVALYSIDAIAKKDVPTGKPYKIVDASEIPADLSQLDALAVSAGIFTDGVGA